MVVRAKLQIITQNAKTNGNKSQAEWNSSKNRPQGHRFMLTCDQFYYSN